MNLHCSLGLDSDCETDIDDFAKAIESAFDGKATVLHRMRLTCSFQTKDGSDMDVDRMWKSLQLRG